MLSHLGEEGKCLHREQLFHVAVYYYETSIFQEHSIDREKKIAPHTQFIHSSLRTQSYLRLSNDYVEILILL
jgi:hypothetical protein